MAKVTTALLVTFGSVIRPRGGMSVRARVAAESLSRLGLEVTVLSTDDDPRAKPAWVGRLETLSREPRLGFSLELVRRLRALTASADFVLLSSALFLPALILAGVRCPVIWDTNECESLHYLRLDRTPRNRLRRIAWRLIEASSWRRARVVVAISEEEARWWVLLFPGIEGRLAVVDHAPFLDDTVAASPEAAVEDNPTLVFVGNLLAKHNAVAARWVVEVLAPRLPEHVTVVLAGPGTERLTVGRVGATVSCLGSTTDLDTVIARADLCLAPLASGAGTKTKMLHYLALRRPVMCTPVAAEGLSGAPGITVVELGGFQEAVMAWLLSPETAAAAATRATRQRLWFEERHSSAIIDGQWRAVLEQANIL